MVVVILEAIFPPLSKDRIDWTTPRHIANMNRSRAIGAVFVTGETLVSLSLSLLSYSLPTSRDFSSPLSFSRETREQIIDRLLGLEVPSFDSSDHAYADLKTGGHYSISCPVRQQHATIVKKETQQKAQQNDHLFLSRAPLGASSSIAAKDKSARKSLPLREFRPCFQLQLESKPLPC